jgi:hypothetical protein
MDTIQCIEVFGPNLQVHLGMAQLLQSLCKLSVSHGEIHYAVSVCAASEILPCLCVFMPHAHASCSCTAVSSRVPLLPLTKIEPVITRVTSGADLSGLRRQYPQLMVSTDQAITSTAGMWVALLIQA